MVFDATVKDMAFPSVDLCKGKQRETWRCEVEVEIYIM